MSSFVHPPAPQIRGYSRPPRLTHHVSTKVSLHLEDFHSAGLSSEETKAEIEKVYDGHSLLSCQPSAINHNWYFTTLVTDPDQIDWIVHEIERRLRDLLAKKSS